MKQSMQYLDTVDIDDFDVILGFPWLWDVNPIVDWQLMMWAYKKGQISNNCNIIPEKKVARALQKGKSIFVAHVKLADDGSVQVALVYSTKRDPKPTVMRPKYADFEDVALEINTGILAPHEAHDHDIVLEPGTSPPH